MMDEEEGMCQEEVTEEEEEEEDNPPYSMSATSLSSLVMAMQSLALCQRRSIGLRGSNQSCELGGHPQRHVQQQPERESLPLGMRNGTRCRRRRRRRRRRGKRRRRSISPCTMRAMANTRGTTSSGCFHEFWRLKVRTCMAEK
ncbi:hypothetical protein HGM15179_011579 [Zosterops borbonicus]|uniref:Uncharacterized protein n=1 Tax=Zosterops borbonicus TaxID=364589 RepID=A0A8K1GC40_9PASS|nr:hypothetical protein HGM15179_011579 [Zosterops borbonicus]